MIITLKIIAVNILLTEVNNKFITKKWKLIAIFKTFPCCEATNIPQDLRSLPHLHFHGFIICCNPIPQKENQVYG